VSLSAREMQTVYPYMFHKFNNICSNGAINRELMVSEFS
jgi:hypothetical protein